MKGFLKVALYYTIYSVVITLAARFFVPIEELFGLKMVLFQMILGMIILIFLGRKFLRNEDYALSFGEALKDLFLATMISSVITMLIGTAIYSGQPEIHEKYVNNQIEAAIKGTAWGMEIAGVGEDEIEIKKLEMREAYDSGEIPKPEFPMQWKSLPIMILSSLIGAFFSSLIASIFVKQKAGGA